ncbi:MAG: TIM44-like domain-containing protein [Pyrinomonadaceae bacterium]
MKRSRVITVLLRESFRFSCCIGGALVIMFFAEAASARVGGGHSYGGSGGKGDGNGGDVGAVIGIVRLLVYLTVEYPAVGVPIDIIVIVYVVYRFSRSRNKGSESFSTEAAVTLVPGAIGQSSENLDRGFEQLRKFDPNFSQIVFSDFCYSLYGKAHDARGRGLGALDRFSPYLSDSARNALIQRNPVGLREVRGTIIGAMNIVDLRGLDRPLINMSVLFEANYTEVLAAEGRPPDTTTYYVRERWDLERRRDVLSPPPAQATALHCPRCGAPLQKDTVGACAFCRTRIDGGDFQWYVRGINLVEQQTKGPLFTGEVPESGTNLPSIVQSNFGSIRVRFEMNCPMFSWTDFEARARLIFNELQQAWSTLDWERARPHETDNLFQMHQYWIEAYKRQRLRNVLDHSSIYSVEPVKIQSDAFYNAITLRIRAEGYDYTVEEGGNIVAGSKDNLRHWSEYWTFIRTHKTGAAPARADLNCPNCGAPLKINNAGVCQFCGGKITSGEFDWVVSKIEQDESYQG